MTVRASWTQVTRAGTVVIPRGVTVSYEGRLATPSNSGTFSADDDDAVGSTITVSRNWDVEYGDLITGEVSASAAGYQDSQTVDAELRVNSPPTIQSATSAVVRGSTHTPTFTADFDDEDTDSVSLSITRITTSVTTSTNPFVTISGNTIQFGNVGDPPGAYPTGSQWVAEVTITDEYGLTGTGTFTLRVVAQPNRPPTWQAVNPVVLLINESTTINLLDFASDPDDDTLTFSLGDAPDLVTAVLSRPSPDAVSNSRLTITAGSSTGSTSFDVTANDGRINGTASTTISVTVRRPVVVNDPPECTDIEVDLGSGDSMNVFPDEFVTDPEGRTVTISGIQFAPLSPHTQTTVGGRVRLTLRRGSASTMSRHRVASYTATDDGGNSCSSDIYLSWDAPVAPPNTPPEWSSFPTDIEINVNDSRDLDLSDYASDIDGDTLSYSVSPSSAGALTFSIVNTDTLRMRAGPNPGNGTTTVTVSDGEDSANQSITVTVVRPAPQNQPPVCNPIHIVIGSGGSSREEDVVGYATDPDDPDEDLVYEISQTFGSHSSRGTTFIARRQTGHTAGVSYDAGAYTAEDEFGGRCQGDISYEWTAAQVNRPPDWGNLPLPTYVTTSRTGSTYDVRSYVSDPDGDALTFAVIGYTPQLFTEQPTISNGRVVFTIRNDVTPPMAGSVIVTASDGTLTVGRALRFQFNAVANQPPVWQSIPTQYSTTRSGRTEDISGYVSDPDGSISQIRISSWSAFQLQNVQYNTAGGYVEFTIASSVSLGTRMSITVQAVDNDGARSNQSFDVIYGQAPPGGDQ